ncbi:MAG: HAMP domain-containing protein, partial [Chloroflexota bacterium]
MTPFFQLIGQSMYIDPPQGWVGWVGFVILLGILLWVLWRWREFNAPGNLRQRLLTLALALAAGPAGLFIGLQLTSEAALPPPGLPAEPPAPTALIFAALPWMLAGGFSGPLAAALVGLVSGLAAAAWQTHNMFTILEFGLLAAAFGAAVRQRYRTPLYRLLHQPLAAALLLALFFPFMHLLVTPFAAQGLLVSRLDYALTNLRGLSMAVGLQLLIGGVICQLLAIVLPNRWGSNAALAPSPAEKSLQTRFIVNLSPVALLLVLALMISNWVIAGQAARTMLRSQMAATAEVAAEHIPYFLETGQSLILRLADDPVLLDTDADILAQQLSESIKVVPFFNQLSVIDLSGNALASYPTNTFVGKQAPVEEQMGIQMVFNGVPFQAFTIPPASGQTTAQVSFVAAINDASGLPARVLVGRSDLANNPFTKPVLGSLQQAAGIGGQGMLIDENERILVHSDPGRLMTTYDGLIAEQPLFYDGAGWDGTRQLFYYQPVPGRPWAVVLSVPANQAQQIAISIAFPLLAMTAILSLVGVTLMRWSLGLVTRSLQKLTGDAARLAEGRLDRAVQVESVDEVGQLGRAFEQMRASLKARLDELNRLLLVSQGVASSLEVSEAIQPVLESALASGSSARVVITPAVLPDLDGRASAPLSFGLGPSSAQYTHLDEQVLALTRQQDRLVLSNLLRPRLLNLQP